MRKYSLLGSVLLCAVLALTLVGSADAGSVTLCLTGDILLDRGVKTKLNTYGFDYPYANVQSVLRAADITFGNLECPLTDGGVPSLKRRDLVFKANPSNAAALARAGYDVLNLANNHTMDQGAQGLSDTVSTLTHSGLRVVGAGEGRKNARSPLFVKSRAITIGFLGYSDFPPEGYIHSEQDYAVSGVDESAMKAEISATKQSCDFLVVSLHFGREFTHVVSDNQKRIARLCAEAGANIIVGHHPHVLQGMERYQNALIFYSLGNFVFDKQVPPGTDETMIVRLHVSRTGIENVELLPVIIQSCQPVLATGKEKQTILDRFDQYCSMAAK